MHVLQRDQQFRRQNPGLKLRVEAEKHIPRVRAEHAAVDEQGTHAYRADLGLQLDQVPGQAGQRDPDRVTGH